jgi:hypothetical protein
MTSNTYGVDSAGVHMAPADNPVLSHRTVERIFVPSWKRMRKWRVD